MRPLLLRALVGEPTERAPIWLMRQAGRYLPEYRRFKEQVAKNDFLAMVQKPEWAAEITLQPWERFKVDGLILFSDILTILPAMGLQLAFQPHPVLEQNALEYGIEKLRVPDPAVDIKFVGEAIGLIQKQKKAPLVGFAGAPYTTASYALQKGRHDALMPKVLYYKNRERYHVLLTKLSCTIRDYLSFQLSSGADAVMLFDSWVGVLSVEDYRLMAEPYLAPILEHLKNAFPEKSVIYFGLGAGHLLHELIKLKVHCLGLDARTDLQAAQALLRGKKAIQGNLDNTLLFAPPQKVKLAAEKILGQMDGYPGFVFNLGHGLLPDTPVEHVAELIRTVQNYFFTSNQLQSPTVQLP